MQVTQLCCVRAYHSLYEYLLAFGISASQCKKFLTKKILNQSLLSQQEIQIPTDLLMHGQVNPIYNGPEIPILFEDQHFLVLNKPSGIHGHPLLYSDQFNCLSFLRQKGIYSPLAVDHDRPEKGLLYRLDFETSGVLVVVKDKDLHQNLREKFNSLEMKKIYYAIVEGKYSGPIETRIEHQLDDSRPKVKLAKGENGRAAKMQILEANYFTERDQTLLKIELITGVRHQLRVQLSGLGHPIIGDPLYGMEGSRLMLHAFEYSLHLGDQHFSWQAEVPRTFW